MSGSGLWRAFAPAAALVVLLGCGKTYEIRFDLEDVVNQYGEQAAQRTGLRVDILCLTPEEAEANPGVANGSMLADAWFAARNQRDSGGIAKIDPGHIYALREGAPDDQWDRLLGPSLLSREDAGSDVNRNPTFPIKHEDPGGGAKIVVYAGFTDAAGQGWAKNRPLVIDPPGWGKREIRIAVGKKSIRRVDGD